MPWVRRAEWPTDSWRRLRDPPAGPGRDIRLNLVRDESGGVTAEFAIVVPVVLVVLGLVIGGVALSAHRIVLVSAAADIARLEARGESADPRLASLGAGVDVERQQSDGLLCVSLTSAPIGGLLSSVSVGARGCAAISDVAALDEE